MKLTRAKFENLIHDLVEELRLPVGNALKDARLTKQDIEEVILVGGSIRVPAVQKMVKDLTGKEQKVTISNSSNLDKAEIDRMIEDAKRYSEEDRKRKQEAEARNHADGICYNAGHQLEAMGETILAADKEKAQEAIKRLRQALEEKAPIDQIEAMVQELEEIMQGLEPVTTIDTSQAADDSEVIDAEFDEN